MAPIVADCGGVLSERQRVEFEECGVIHLRGAFAAEDADRMRRLVWSELAARGVVEDDASTWRAGAGTIGLSKAVKRDEAFAAVGSVAVLGAVDDLLGQGGWDLPPHWGQVMVTLPDARRPWRVPTRPWHVDYGYSHRPEPLFGVKVFAFFTEVRARGGGTVVVTGSHRVLARFLAAQPPLIRADAARCRAAFLTHHSWLRALTRSDDHDPGRTARFMDCDHEVAGIAVRVRELTGQPGDVVLTHPWVLHCPAPNTSTYPRMMVTKNLYRRDAAP